MDSDDDDYSTTDSSSSSTTAIPPPSAGILMLSLPDSQDDDDGADDKSSADQDVFETPPEYALAGTSQDKTPLLDLDQIRDDDEDRDYEVVGDRSGVVVAVGGCCEEGDGAVDLGGDSDPVISESESVETMVSKRDLSREASSAESSPPSKKLKVSEGNSDKSEEELVTEQLNLSNLGSGSDQTLEIAGYDDAKSVSSGKKQVENSGSESENGTEKTQQVTEESGSTFGMEFSFQEEWEVDSQVLRVLPMSFCPPADSSRMQAEEGHEWSSLLEMVNVVKDLTRKEDNTVEKCSFLEIAKRRGMTFPRL